MQKKHLLLILLMALFMPLAMNGQETIKANRPLQFNSERGLLEMNGTSGTTNHGDRKTTYELVTASQTDWSGNYVLVGPFNITTSYAFNGEVITSSGINLGRTTAVTIDGTTLSSIGNAAVLTIAKSTSDDSHYSIRINGDKYLTSIYNGLRTSLNETESYWNITYTTNGMQIYCPWNGDQNYLYFVVYRDISTGDYGTMFYICKEGDLDHYEYHNFEYVFPDLYKETTTSVDCEDFESYASFASEEINYSNGTVPPGWGVSGNTGNYKPHLYNGFYSVDGVGIVFTSGTSAYGGNNSYLYSNIILHQGNEVSFNTFTESTTASTRDMYYGYWKNNTFQSLGTAESVKYKDSHGSYVDATQGVTTFTVPAEADGYPLAWRWYNSATNWSAVIDNVCVATAKNLQVTVWTETNQHPAWGTVQIDNNTPVTNVATNVEDGTPITVTATPDECHTFAYWIPNGGGNNITDNPTTITVNDDLDLQAVFTPITYNVTMTSNNSSYGSVSGGGNNLECGSSCTLTATANSGYGFMGWQLNGNIVSTDNPHTITVNANVVYTAVFEAASEHTITVTQATGGTISADPNTACIGSVITLSATLENGYFFADWIVKDASNDSITVTNNHFTMPNSDVTVTASITQGFHVTLVQTANGTISANPTTHLQLGDPVTLTATPYDGCGFLAWYVYKTGNPRDVISVVNNGFVMPSSDVTVQAVFVTEEEHVQTVGGGSSSTDNHLPTTAFFKYSLTQQIYTAAEIVYNGKITKIAFKATSNFSDARSLDIYMSHTSKTAFGSNTDWEVMGHDALVYSGNVSFANDAWTTITLDTPFEYDGTSNLNICVVDKTGGGETSAKYFGRYRTNANRSLYICNDNNDYSSSVGDSNLLSNFRGSRQITNNQIVFTIEPGSAKSLTISPDEISNFSYLEGQGPSQTHKLDIVGVDLENNITLTAPNNFEISLTEYGPYNSSLTIPRVTSKRNRNVQTWDFENGLQRWTVVDADGDGFYWLHNTSFGGHGGSKGLVYSQSYDNEVANPLHPDNWLISPQVYLGGVFSMWAHPYQATYHAEHFAIMVSTTDINASSFTLLGEWTLSSGDWKQFSVDLSDYAGQIGYIAIRHYNCSGQLYINVDDFVLDTDATFVEMPVTFTPATVFVRMKGNLSAGTYSGTLTASASSGTKINRSVSLSGEVIAANIGLTKEITGYGNGTGNWYLIASPLADNVAPTNVDGMITDNLGATATTETSTYDLYSFDQSEELEWQNYRASNFSIESGQGYLYASKEGTTLTFTGMPYSGNTKDVTLTYSTTNSDANMHGWNLVGNPFNEIAYIDMPFYTLDGDSEYVEKAAGAPINPMQGVLVHIGENDPTTLTFSTTPISKNARLTLNLTQGRSITDYAILSFNESKPLPKMQLRENSTKVYFPVDGKDYAVVSAEESMGEIPVNFKAESNGTYTISFTSEEVSFAYLHLIDNMTGIETDLLANPSYSFDARTTDYESRFKLVFATGNNANDDAFAFYSNGSFVINNPSTSSGTSEATLQVIDVNGRILKSESINGCTNLNINAAQGIYMLRLVNGDNVKVQKVMVR